MSVVCIKGYAEFNESGSIAVEDDDTFIISTTMRKVPIPGLGYSERLVTIFCDSTDIVSNTENCTIIKFSSTVSARCES